MRIVFFLFVSTFFAFSSELLTYNIYERSDRIDIMLSFDAPYDGKIKQHQGSDFTSLVLEDLSFSKSIKESINSNILQELIIKQSANSTIVTVKSAKHIGLFASKTIDGFGLRLRIKLVAPVMKDIVTNENIKSQNTSSMLDYRYFAVIFVLILLLLFLYILKRKLNNKISSKTLFKNTNNINIIAQKPLDPQNNISLIDYKGSQYLILSGTSNIILDRYDSNGVSIESKEDFELLFEANQKKLSKYLNNQTPNQLSIYKQKASQDFIKN